MAQESQPTSSPNTQPSSAPTSAPASAPSSQPTSQRAPESEPSPDTERLSLPALPLLPSASLVLRGLPEPVKNIRLGLHAEHIVFRNLPTDVGPDLTSFDTVVFLISKRLFTGLVLETRLPVSHQARNDFDVDGELVEATQDNAFGNISFTLNQSFAGRYRKAVSVELVLPTTGSSPESLATGAFSAISSRYELPLFLPGVFAARARVAAGSTFSKIGAMVELGLDTLVATGDASALPQSLQLDLRGGASLSYFASEYLSLYGELTFAASLNDLDENDGFVGDIDNMTALHFGARTFLGRVSVGFFLTIPQDDPLDSLSTLGVGIDVFSALF
jgi:hypothetical protein